MIAPAVPQTLYEEIAYVETDTTNYFRYVEADPINCFRCGREASNIEIFVDQADPSWAEVRLTCECGYSWGQRIQWLP